MDSFSERQQIESAARRYLIPYIHIGMDVHDLGNQFAISGQVILSMPGELCMQCMGFLRDDLLAREAANYGAAGSRPQVIWPNGVLASLAVGIFVQLMTPWHKNHRQVWYLEYDENSQTVFLKAAITIGRLHPSGDGVGILLVRHSSLAEETPVP